MTENERQTVRLYPIRGGLCRDFSVDCWREPVLRCLLAVGLHLVPAIGLIAEVLQLIPVPGDGPTPILA